MVDIFNFILAIINILLCAFNREVGGVCGWGVALIYISIEIWGKP